MPGSIEMMRPQWISLLYTLFCVFNIVYSNGALSKRLTSGKDAASRAVVLQGTHDNSMASVSSRYPKGSGFGSIRGKSRSVSGLLNSIDSHRVHDSLKTTVGNALHGRSKNNLINQALRRISKISDAQSIPGLPVGTVSGSKLTTSQKLILPSTRKSSRTSRRMTSAGGISARSRTRSRSHLGSRLTHGSRRRGSHLTTARGGHEGTQHGGVSMAGRRSRHRSTGLRTGRISKGSSLRTIGVGHISRGSSSGSTAGHLLESGSGLLTSSAGVLQHGSVSHADLTNAGHQRGSSAHNIADQLIESSRGRHASLAGVQHGSLSHLDLVNGGHQRAKLSSASSVGQGASDAHLIASILEQENPSGIHHYDVKALLPNFVAEEPQIFLDKQSSVRDAYPQIVVGRPEPLLAAPLLPLALGSDGHVMTSSNNQMKEVLKSVLNTLSSSKSLSQQGIGSLMQSIRNTVDDGKRILVTGVRGPKIELSPIIHAGSKAVSTENIIRIKEPGKISPIVLKTGGQLEISSGVSGNPTFKIYGFLPAKTGKISNDESDNDELKKIKII